MYAAVLAALLDFLFQALPKVAVFFGVVALSTTVIIPVFEGFKAAALAEVSKNAGTFLNAFELMGGFDCISIVFAGYIASFTLKAASKALK